MTLFTSWRTRAGAAALALGLSSLAWAGPNLESSISRPLRYTPDGTDFVITNGPEFFNRPLYGGNSAFRIDAGDKPEFSFYLPGHAGNLRLGFTSARGTFWLNDAKMIIARYRPGSYVYEISDPNLGEWPLKITAIALRDAEGLVLKVEGAPAGELLWTFGGMDGQRGSRGGDIGAERIPVGQMFQIKPEFAKENRVDVQGDHFTLTGGIAAIAGTSSPASTLAVADAKSWGSAGNLLASSGKPTDLPVVLGRLGLDAGAAPAYVVIQRVTKKDAPTTAPSPALAALYASAGLSKIFDTAESQRQRVVAHLVVETPDPYINAAAAALTVAADGTWDEREGAFMHGAVAWRNKLLGWRGPYMGDALGQHDRTRRHLENWFSKQNTKNIPDAIPAPEETANYSRNETALHSNGDLSNSHYDMNLPAIDVLFRHLLWTGDVEYARQVWPVIERHLAWERRLFRRPFGNGADALPLYEAYCCIWASDDLAYNGGGATHSSAYNYFHNEMAGRVATLIGKDPAPYQAEADLILKGMHRELWMPDKGSFGEWRDLLGLKQIHPAIGLWTFYHTVDSEVCTPLEAWEMSRYVDTTIRKIPVKGPGVPDDGAFTLPTTNWFPYQWSTNNVVMAESAHTALAMWQSGRIDDANQLFKGLLLDSMYLGLCPGNAGMCTFYDDARGESQRDFADACGTVSRTFVEGLFGIKPDALAGELVIRPGFPAAWNSASLKHPDVSLSFRREGMADTYSVGAKFKKRMNVRLQLAAPRDGVEAVTVNGIAAKWKVLEDTVGQPRIEIAAGPAELNEVRVQWRGEPSAAPVISLTNGGMLDVHLPGKLLDLADPQGILQMPLAARSEAGFQAALSRAADSADTVFARVQKGDLTWWIGLNLESVGSGKSKPAAGEFAAIDWQKPLASSIKLEPVDLASVFNDNVTQIFKNKYVSNRSPFCSLALPWQGFGSWCHPTDTFDVDDTGLRALADKSGGKLNLPNGVPLATPGRGGGKNVLFTSRWENYPAEAAVQLAGKSSHAYFMMAGSTNSMQSQFDNGEVIVTYADGSTDRLALRNPTTWWPIDQDYAIDDYAFYRPGLVPPRVDLKTGAIRIRAGDETASKGKKIAGGAATILDLPLDASKELQSLTVRALSNEVVIGLMSVTLAR